jgi:hypothetical protein
MSDKTNRDPGWDDVRVTYSSDISNYASDGAQLSADEDAVRLWHVGITRLEWDDYDDNSPPTEHRIGHATVVSLDLARGLNTGLDWFELLDGESADISSAAQHLFDGSYLRDEVSDHLELDEPPWTVLLLDHMILDEQERGKGLGPQVARHIIRRLGSDGSTLVAAYPQPDGWGDMDAETYAKAKAKVERAWAGVGFTHFENGHWLMNYDARHL